MLGGDLRHVRRKDHGTLKNVSQFAHVAGPGVLLQDTESAGREDLARSISTQAREEMAGERGKVVETFA